MGAKAAEMLVKSGVRVPGYFPGPEARRDDIHLIFEYKPGLVPLAEGALPRNNRFIASPKKTAENTILPKSSFRTILPDVSSCTRAFLSGYQYLQDEEEFIRAADQIRVLKTCNPQMRVHIECVSVTDTHVLAGLVHHILPVADSAGMNEHELWTPARARTGTRFTPQISCRESWILPTRPGLSGSISTHSGITCSSSGRIGRIPEASRAALLYAARVVAELPGVLVPAFHRCGIDAIRQIGEVVRTGPDTGDLHFRGIT